MDIDEVMEKMRRDLRLPSPAESLLSPEEIMRRVRDEIAHRRKPNGSETAAAGQTERADLVYWVPSAERLPSQAAYRLSDLLSFSDLDFVDQCYRIVLRRPPDRTSLDHYVAQLRLGRLSKVEVLGEMRFSPEGMSRGVHIDGLLLPYRLHQAMKWPLLGPLLRWGHALLRLGSHASRLQQLDAAQAREAQCLGHTLNRVAAQLDERIGETARAVRHDLDQARAEEQTARARLDARTAVVESMLPQLAREEDVVRALASTEARAAAVEAVLPGLARQDALAALVDETTTAAAQLAQRALALEAALPQLAAREQLDAGLEEVRQLAVTLQAQVQQTASHEYVEGLRHALHAALEELRRVSDHLGQRIEAGEQALATLEEGRRRAEESARAFDPFYAAFEDRFRGSRELVRSRVEPYLEWVRDVGAGTREAPVLDLGCGRGEWLELLRDHQMHASGIDLNSTFVDTCRSRGLEVQHADVMDGLAERAGQSVGAITSMHLVEHLPFEVAIAMIDEARRVLRPGGLLVLETPNPENLRVGAHWFYLDPTHRNPIPPESLRWLVESRGFQAVRIERLTHGRDLPWPGRVADDVPGAETINAMSDQFVAAPDYAIVAVRP